MRLHDGVLRYSRETPDGLAIISGQEAVSYRELDCMANKIGRAMLESGIGKGSRIGIWLVKSPLVVAVMQACSRIGAIYVPIDPLSPLPRAELILNSCGASLLVTSAGLATGLVNNASAIKYLFVDEGPGVMSWSQVMDLSPESLPDPGTQSGDPAYILHTSGSTGRPKGVTVSHNNALAFVHWAIKELNIGPGDRLANHASFHFDLSVLDLYGAFFSGATVCLIPEDINYSTDKLLQFIKIHEPTIWYSVPSVLMMMMEYGTLLSLENTSIRVLIFAGEVFPIRHLRLLRNHWKSIRMFNFYGPTETNVCTYYEVRHIEDSRMSPVPIGRACPYCTVWAEKLDGARAKVGEVGELVVSGETVMIGYWGTGFDRDRYLPNGEKDEQVYRTGDLVTVLPDGNFEYNGRIDQMVKVRGQRIELGEITSILQTHESIIDAAVVVSGEGLDAKLIAIIVSKEKRLSLLEVKAYCALYLPRSMIVDGIRYARSLPRTRNGKLDKQMLQEQYS